MLGMNGILGKLFRLTGWISVFLFYAYVEVYALQDATSLSGVIARIIAAMVVATLAMLIPILVAAGVGIAMDLEHENTWPGVANMLMTSLGILIWGISISGWALTTVF